MTRNVCVSWFSASLYLETGQADNVECSKSTTTATGNKNDRERYEMHLMEIYSHEIFHILNCARKEFGWWHYQSATNSGSHGCHNQQSKEKEKGRVRKRDRVVS